MRARRLPWTVRLALIALVGSIATPAYAQLDRPARPYRGLFGGSRNADSTQALDLSLSLIGAYDDNVLADEGRGFSDIRLLEAGVRQSGYFAALQGQLAYSRRWSLMSVHASIGGVLRQYPHLNDPQFIHRAGVGFNMGEGFDLWKGAKIRFGGNVSYVSNDRLHLLVVSEPDTGFLEQLDYSISSQDRFRYVADVRLTQKLGRATSLSTGYAYVGWDQSSFQAYDASFAFRRSLTRYASLAFRYSYRVAKYPGRGFERTSGALALDGGYEYGRALSLTRRTSLSFGTGLSVLTRPQLPEVPEGGRELRLRERVGLNGNASLIHEIGRSWRAQLMYSRGLRFVEGLSEAVFSDSVSGTLGGYLRPRVDFSAVGAYSAGSSTYNQSRKFSTYTFSTQVRYGINRWLGLFGQYFFYHYTLNPEFARTAALPSGFDRQGARVGLTTIVPLIR